MRCRKRIEVVHDRASAFGRGVGDPGAEGAVQAFFFAADADGSIDADELAVVTPAASAGEARTTGADGPDVDCYLDSAEPAGDLVEVVPPSQDFVPQVGLPSYERRPRQGCPPVLDEAVKSADSVRQDRMPDELVEDLVGKDCSLLDVNPEVTEDDVHALRPLRFLALRNWPIAAHSLPARRSRQAPEMTLDQLSSALVGLRRHQRHIRGRVGVGR